MAAVSKKGTSCQWCAALNCSNSRYKNPEMSFFRFPKEHERCRGWVINCRRADLDNKSSSSLHRGGYVLCEKHFEQSCIRKNRQRTRLLKDSFPTLFDIPNPPQCLKSSRRPSPKKRVKEVNMEELNPLSCGDTLDSGTIKKENPESPALDSGTIKKENPESPASSTVNVAGSSETDQNTDRTFRFSSAPSLEDLRKMSMDFIKERNWDQFHSPRNVLLALVGEVGELAEIFQWKGEVTEGLPELSEKERDHVGQEISDVLLYLIDLAVRCRIDLPKAVIEKMAANAKKYSVENSYGKSNKYTDYE